MAVVWEWKQNNSLGGQFRHEMKSLDWWDRSRDKEVNGFEEELPKAGCRRKRKRRKIKDDIFLAWAVHCHLLRWEDWKREKEVRVIFWMCFIWQVELSDMHLHCINESGAQGRGQSYTSKCGCHHLRDSIQSKEVQWDHLALAIAGEEKMTQEQVLGHSNIYRLERRVEASKRKPGECDVMDPVRGGF